MPHYVLFEFFGVQNNLVRITLGGVKNYSIPQPKLHSPILGLLLCKNCYFLVYFYPLTPSIPTFDFIPMANSNRRNAVKTRSGNHGRKQPQKGPPRDFITDIRAPFGKAPNGFIAQWGIEEGLQLEASGGLFGMRRSLTTIGSGVFRIIPLRLCRIRAEYSSPTFILKYEKLRDILRTRFEFEVDILPWWKENLWPYLFDHYVKYGEWPTTKNEYRTIFLELLTERDLDKKEQPEADTRAGAAPKGGDVSELSHKERIRLAGMLAEDARFLTDRLVSSKFFDLGLAAVELFTKILDTESLVPLKGEFLKDSFRIRFPAEIATARRILILDKARVEFRWKYGEFFDRRFHSSMLELYQPPTFVLPSYAWIYAPRMQLTLANESRKKYRHGRTPPLILKGENVSFELLKEPQRKHSRLALRRRSGGSSKNPTDLNIRVQWSRP
jgi:hypothetical protein